MEPITLALLFAFQPISGNAADFEVAEQVLWAEQVTPRVAPARIVEDGSTLRLSTQFDSWEMTGIIAASNSTPTVVLCDGQLTAFVAGWADEAPVLASFGAWGERTISLDGDPASAVVPVDSESCDVLVVDGMGTLHNVRGQDHVRHDETIDFIADTDELERGVALSYLDGYALVGDRDRGLTALRLQDEAVARFQLSDRVVPGFVADERGEGVWLTTRDGNLWFWRVAYAPELVWPGDSASATGLTSAVCGDAACLVWGTERGDVIAYDGTQADIIVSTPEPIRAPIVSADLLDAGSPQWVVTTTQARAILIAWTTDGPSSTLFSTGFRTTHGLGIAQTDVTRSPEFIVPTTAHHSLEVPTGDVGANPFRGATGMAWPGAPIDDGRLVAMNDTTVTPPEGTTLGEPLIGEPNTEEEPEPSEPAPWEAVEDVDQEPAPTFDDRVSSEDAEADTGPDFWALEPQGPTETDPVPQGPSCSAAGAAPSASWLLLSFGLLAVRRRS